MQPTYLPWLGYLDILRCADLFLVFDTAQFSAQSWHQRNRVKTAAGVRWLTVPVRHELGASLHEARIGEDARWRKKHAQTVRQAYARAPFLHPYADQYEAILARAHGLLADLTTDLLRWLAESFGLRTCIQRVSALGVDTGAPRSQRLADICRGVGASRYLSPAGSEAYLVEDDVLPGGAIPVSVQRFRPVEYRQEHGAFEPFLSALDALLNVGPGAARLLEEGSAWEILKPRTPRS